MKTIEIHAHKTKDFLKKYFFILLSFFIIVIAAFFEKILHYNNIDFRDWFKFFIISMAIMSLLIGIIIINRKNELFKKIMNCILTIFMFLVILGTIFWNYTSFFGYVLVRTMGLTSIEYEVDTIYGKKVVYLDPFLTDTTIEIHDYYNAFLCSDSYAWESYSGSYNYIDKDKIEKILDNQNKKYD